MKLSKLALALVLALALSSPALAQPAFKSKIATNQPGQSWMIIGNALSEYGKETIELSVEPGSTYGNIITTNAGDTQYGITAQTSISSALDGVRFYERFGPQKNIRFVASLFRHYMKALVVDPNLKKMEDLKGKSISFGPAGGESHEYGPQFLSYFGLNKGDYEVKVMPFADAIEAMRNGQLDAILNCSPVPYAIFDDLAMSNSNAHILSYGEDAAKKLEADWKGFAYTEYTFDDKWKYEKPLFTPYQQITIVANADVSDEEVYQFTKTLYDHLGDLGNVVSNVKQIGDPKNLADNPVNLTIHPGAEKFYKEMGAM